MDGGTLLRSGGPTRRRRDAGYAWPLSLLAGVLALSVFVLVPTLGAVTLLGGIAMGLAAWTPAAPLAVAEVDVLVSLAAPGRVPPGGTVVLFSAWTLAAVTLYLLRRRPAVPLRGLVDISGLAALGLVVVLALGLIGTDEPEYGALKLQLFVLKVVLPFTLAVLIGASRRDLRLFVEIVLVLGVIAAVVDVGLILSGQAAESNADRLTLDESVDPIGLARLMARILLVLLYALSRPAGTRRRVLLVAALLPCFVALLASGSRGPLTALVLATPLLVLTRIRDPRALKRLLVTIGVGLALGSVVVSLAVPPETVTRALSAFGGADETTEANQRATLWAQAVTAIPEDPLGVVFGIGTGGFAGVNPDERYPHNIVLELLLETGLAGAALIVIALVSAFQRLSGLAFRGGETGAQAGLILSLFVADAFNAMFSGDVAGNGSLWTWIGLGTGLVAADRAARRRGPDLGRPA